MGEVSFSLFVGKAENGYFVNTGYAYISVDEKSGAMRICKKGLCFRKYIEENVFVSGEGLIDLIYIKKDSYISKYVYEKITLSGYKFNMDIVPKGMTIEEIYVIQEGRDPSSLKIRIENADRIYISQSGELVIEINGEKIFYTRPIAYQYDDNKRHYVYAKYKVEGNAYYFVVDNYDRNKELYIDPVLKFSYFGGSGNESAISIAKGMNGDIYITGFTTSVDLKGKSVNEYRSKEFGSWDIYIARFDKNLKKLKSVMIIGGSKEEWARDIIIDEEGYVYIGGWTHSEDLPVTDGSSKKKDADIFIAKIDPYLKELLFLGYMGGNGYDYAYTMEYDDSYIYIAGETSSYDFPVTEDAYDRVYNGGTIDIFITKFDKDLNIISSTFLGGKEGDAPLAMHVDKDGVYIGGLTWSNDLPVTEGAFDNTYNGAYDAYIAIFDRDLKYLKALTYLGGSHNDNVSYIDVHRNRVVVGGKTFSHDFPITPHVMKSVMLEDKNSDGFVSILSKDLKRLKASTYIGGSEGDEVAEGIVLDKFLILTGATSSTDFPYVNGTVGGKADGFVMIIDYSLRNVYHSSFLGKDTYDIASDIVFVEDKVYVSGWSLYLDKGPKEKGMMEAFIILYDPEIPLITINQLLMFGLVSLMWISLFAGIIYYYRR